MPETVQYILVDGHCHSGHTVVARELCKELQRKGVHTIQDSMNAPIKHFLATALGERIDRIPMQSPVAVLGGIEPLWLMRAIRKGVQDNCGEDVFGKVFVNRVLRMIPLPDFVICDDCTREDYEALPNAIVIRVDRNKEHHRGNLGLPNYVFDNSTDMANLWLGVERLVAEIRSKEKR